MKSFSFRLNSIIIMIMTATLLGMGLYAAGLVERVYYDTLSNRLSREATLISSFLDIRNDLASENSQELQKFINQIAKVEDLRITLIAKNGEVLADSEADPKQMENHANRPEVIEALHNKEGHAVRFSHTLNEEMIYVAHVLGEKDGTIKGVIRLSLSIAKIKEFIHNLWLSLGFAMIAALLITTIVSLFVSKKITLPIEEITTVARKITQKHYASRVNVKDDGEIGQLAQAINLMAASLGAQMQEIKENQEKLSGVLRNMDSGVLLIGELRRILLVNTAVQEMLGYPENSLVNKLHREAKLNYELSELIDKCFATGEKIRDEVHIYFPKERIVDVNLAPYTTDRGEVKGVVTVLHDITAIRRLEKMRSEFVANVSHELKTPITSIKGFAETLLDGAMEDKDLARQFLKIIFHESGRLDRLVHDILELSKIEQKKLPLKLEKIDISQVVQEVYVQMKEKMAAKNIQYAFTSSGHPLIDADKDRFYQIVMNLLDNAISYTPDFGKITVDLVDHGEQMELIIADSGIGIPAAEQERIFERFYRVDKGRARNSGGTGLGLAIVKHLVESHYGKIILESEEGKGSVFKLYFSKEQH